MSFGDFFKEHRLPLIGYFLMHNRCSVGAELQPPYPPSALTDDDLESLIDDLERAMPLEGMITDLKDWDLRLFDLLGADWFFGAAFGPESYVESYASDLAQIFRGRTDALALDYDQRSDPAAFASLVEREALDFVITWRSNIFERYARDQ